ncbi:MAG: hypothetical protein ABI361_07295 [Nitrososphaera sp.]|jgi:hypothetical protein
MSEQKREDSASVEDPMSPENINAREPAAVDREMSDQKIVDKGSTGTNAEEGSEIVQKSGMAKGTDGAWQTGNTYEQGAAGTNQ